jgi:hypothetical protein
MVVESSRRAIDFYTCNLSGWNPERGIMKKLPRTIKYVSVAAGVILIAACGTQMMQTEGSRVHFHASKTGAVNGVEILPSGNFSTGECDTVTAVLAHYPKSIYKIQFYQNGTARRTIGNLNALVNSKDKQEMDAKVARVATTARSTGFTGCAICVGFCVGNSSTNKALDAKAEELVKQLRPILEKPQAR